MQSQTICDPCLGRKIHFDMKRSWHYAPFFRFKQARRRIFCKECFLHRALRTLSSPAVLRDAKKQHPKPCLRRFATGLLTKSQLDLTQAQFFPSDSRRCREAQQSDNQFLLTYQVVVNSLVTTRHLPDCQMLWVIISTFAAWVFFLLAFARVRSCTMHA